jgi:hypothetical protein
MKERAQMLRNAARHAAAAPGEKEWAAVLFLGLLWAAWIAWQLPLVEGRDYGRYITAFYDLGMHSPAQPVTMMYRGFLTSLLIGLFHEAGGAWVFEAAAAAGLLFVWNAVFSMASRFGRAAGWLALAFLAADVPFWSLFRSVASEPFWIVGLLGWYLALRAAFVSPRWWPAVVLGLATAALPLIRPSGQPMLAGCLLLLGASGGWRRNAPRALLALGVAAAPLLLYAGYNAWRYQDFTIARGSKATLPFMRLMVTDGLVHPENGPASQTVDAMVRQRLLPVSPYAEYGLDSEAFFAGGGTRPYWDLLYAADAEYGWDDDYAILKQMAVEAVRTHPVEYLEAVASSLAIQFELTEQPFGWARTAEERQRQLRERLRAGWEAKGLEIPDEGELIPRSAMHWVKSRPPGYQVSKRSDWASAGIKRAHEVFPEKRKETPAFKRWEALGKRVWIPVFFWVAAGTLLLAAFRGEAWREAGPLLGVGALSLLVLLASVMAIGYVEKYRIVFDPVLLGWGAAGLGFLARRRS